MTQGLLKRLALAAPLVVCLPLCALAADGAAALDSEDSPKIFEEFALTSATTEAPAPMGYPPAPAAAGSPAPCAPAPMGGCAAPGPSCCAPGPSCCAPACGSSCCNDCCSSCQHETGVFDCCTHSLSNFFTCGENCCPQFYASVEATMFDAITHGMHADASIANTTIPNDVSLANGDGFDRFTFSPRITAGIQEGCWGILGRFWYLSDSSSGLNPAFPPAGAGTYNDVRLKAYTADFEVTRSFCLGMSKVMFDFGGRYASFEAGQGQQVTRWADGATDIGFSSAFTDFDFNGLGLTMGFLGRTPIGCNTCISLVWGVRGSILWGDAERSVQTSDSVMEVGSDVQSTNSASEENCDTAFIFESLVGVQWDHELRCLPMSAYFRLAFEYQYWNMGSGGSAAAGSFAVDSPFHGVSDASIGRVDLNLVGLSVGCGFNW
jgi:hypothetical protein